MLQKKIFFGLIKLSILKVEKIFEYSENKIYLKENHLTTGEFVLKQETILIFCW